MNQLVRVLGISEEALVNGVGFRLPDVPPEGHLGYGGPEGDCDLMAIEEKTKAPFLLPAASAGEVWGVEIGSASPSPLTPEEAVECLQAALDQDKAVWIVTKSFEGLKASRRILKRNRKT